MSQYQNKALELILKNQLMIMQQNDVIIMQNELNGHTIPQRVKDEAMEIKHSTVDATSETKDKTQRFLKQYMIAD